MSTSEPPIPDDDALRIACLREGVRDATEGRLDDAETRFREVLASARSTGTKSERLAVSSLLTLFAHEGRDVEALILARRHIALATAAGDAEDLCFAYAAITDALTRLEDWRRLDAAAVEFERSLDAYGGRHEPGLRRHLYRTRVRRELVRGDVAAASAALVRIRDIDAKSRDEQAFESSTRICEAEVGLATGRPDRARAALSRIPAESASIDVGFLAARCALAIEGPDAAIVALAHVVDALESPDAPKHGVAMRLSVARRTAQLAERIGAPLDLTKRAFDVAASMVLLRASEIERAASGMPELAAVDLQDARALAAYRIRFASEQKDLLAAVAALLRRRAAAGEAPSWAHAPGHAAARICPWCLRLRTPEGALLPIGHYLPSGAGFDVKNGACGSCETRMDRV